LDSNGLQKKFADNDVQLTLLPRTLAFQLLDPSLPASSFGRSDLYSATKESHNCSEIMISQSPSVILHPGSFMPLRQAIVSTMLS
jgi:hypothetical protein